MGVTGGTSADSQELLSRGAAILAATVEHVLSSTDINNAEEIVLYGEKSKTLYTLQLKLKRFC